MAQEAAAEGLLSMGLTAGRALTSPEASQTMGCAGVMCPLMKGKSRVALFIC